MGNEVHELEAEDETWVMHEEAKTIAIRCIPPEHVIDLIDVVLGNDVGASSEKPEMPS